MANTINTSKTSVNMTFESDLLQKLSDAIATLEDKIMKSPTKEISVESE